ncbi:MULTISPECIES: rod shape-determining protein MreC [Mammaliicoccus]|uniref:Cell shape-determining protein MreC n=1 Tax=Mammaliicoccus fleurettii TaxID=150056 RepID=A0ABS5MPN5_9STAP|nr:MULTISPECIES: rod shape-determining protein MreC [Mammaliicoccus]MBL0847657.1 rod shape-determining protein MreC [Mammaliicoccus fleurettii]MBO3062322.1 rod shape-determining protein MreC [Mammaliicoccus fleurettii]MBS3672854.1 rod shape-determining protein MreC [Mammaliicoccus fleurettii]MBS3697895.1 rod shape-determining protein MreC [Mammaliicoccus fleurettii]MBW0764221.1 rod shape-determining protein MreC [Mammaliicoccus fleurettii]
MSNFFKNNKLMFFLISMVLLIVIVGYSVRAQSASLSEQYASDTSSFGGRIISYPVTFVSDFFSNIFTSDEDINKLKEEVKSTDQIKADKARLEKENKSLKKELDMKDISQFNPISATVIGRSPDQWMNTIIIDKGKKSGMKENMAVITSEGLVGRIKKANQFSSQVELISTSVKTSKLSVDIQQDEENIFGMINRYDEDKDLLVISDIDNKYNIKKGSKVVTNGLGDQLPKGLLVGKVEKVENDEYGLSKVAYIKTSTNIKDLNHVYVAKRDPETIPSSKESGEE